MSSSTAGKIKDSGKANHLKGEIERKNKKKYEDGRQEIGSKSGKDLIVI